MQEYKEIYNQMTETLQAFSPYYREAMIRHLQASNAPANWFPLSFVRAGEPEPFHLTQAELITPFLALPLRRERYDSLAADGCLEVLEDGSYALTEKGRQIVEGFFKVAHEELAEVKVLSTDEMNYLAELLRRIVINTVDSPEPAEKPSLMASRWTDPGPDAEVPARIDQYVTDLIRYRDDAHNGAWRPTGVEGRTWETLTLLWRGEASSVSEVSERLSGRGYSQEDYADSLRILTEMQWITNSNGYRITEEGKKVRERAEENTDRLYYIGWETLSRDELGALSDLLARLNDRLRNDTFNQCWTQAGLLAQAITPITRDAIADEFNKYFETPRAFFPTLMAFGADPDPLTVVDYRMRFPYTSPKRALELLVSAEKSGNLTRDGENFSISSEGKEAIIRVNDVFYRALADLDPLTEAESAELAGLLTIVVEAALAVAEAKGMWSIRNIHNCHPETQYGSLARIDQLLDDLNGFRDDVHIAAWLSYGVSGRDWDALTLVWRDQARSAAAIAKELEPKGYSADEYNQSLIGLVERGWLEESAEGFRISANGSQIRQEAEEATDRLFFEPWQQLDNNQLLRLHTLLVQMKLGLLALAQENSDQDIGA